MDVVAKVEHWLHEMRNGVVRSYGVTLVQAEQGLAEREQAIEYQRRLIQELSVPIVPIHEGVLVLPLVGAIDSRRATQVMEAALEKIVEFQADMLILDITGVPLVDTGVANYLLQMARAVKLLGAQVILVGIGAEIAQTMVQLGVELRDVTTRSNLQAGIAFALAQQGFAISLLAEADISLA
jgi:rsbT co-antagonist protein RsbR